MTKKIFLSRKLACLCTTALIALSIYSLNNNSAHADPIVLAGAGTEATAGIVNGVGVTMSSHALTITSTTDASPFLTLGAITATTGNLSFLTTATASNTSMTIASFNASGTSDVLVSITGTSNKSQTVNVTGNLITLGTLGITADADTATATSRLNVEGNLNTGAITLTPGAAAAILAFNGSSAQTVTGTINGNAANKGTLIAANTSGGVTFNSEIGTVTTNTLSIINVTTGTATFKAATRTLASTISGTATFEAATAITTLVIAPTGTTTLTGVLSAATKVEIDGTLNINKAAQAIEAIDLNSTGIIVIGKELVNGNTINTGFNQVAAGFETGGKIFLPANLKSGQNLIIADRGTIGTGTRDAVQALLQNNALSTYTTAATPNDIIISSTDKSAATTVSELGVNTNKATALLQARDAAAAANTAATDTSSIDGIFNALNAQGGQSATADTNFANQVSPQTDMITGSTIAAKAVTSGVQNVMASRLASLRSGDAYSTGVVTGNGMAANSGFIQAFGSTVEQKAKGNEFGYDADTTGFAIGVDGKVDGGAVIGISYARSEADVDGKGTGRAKNDITTDSVSLYADYATKDGYIEGSITYGQSDNKGSRIINTGGLDRTYSSDYDSEQYSFRLSGGVPQSVGTDAFITPFATATISQIKADAYTERSTTADDALRLRVAQDTVDSQVGSIGVKYHQVIKDGNTTFTPEIKVAVNQEFGDGSITTTNTYQGGGASFKNSTDIEKTSGTAGIGLSIASDNITFNISYDVDVKDQYLGHGAQAKLSAKF